MILPILPLILLCLALGGVFIYQRASHEVTRLLSASSVVICLIWGLAIAHWSIHLLCLLFLLTWRYPSAVWETVKINK